jgi:hypothetical protein
LSLPKRRWRKITWREGTGEKLSSRFARVRICVAHRDYWLSDTRPEEWLLIEWPDGEKEPIKYWCRCGLNVTSPTRLQRHDGDWWPLSLRCYRVAPAARLGTDTDVCSKTNRPLKKLADRPSEYDSGVRADWEAWMRGADEWGGDLALRRSIHCASCCSVGRCCAMRLDDPTTDRSGGRSNTPSVRSLMGGCEEVVPR